MKYLIKISDAASVQNIDILYLTRECNSIHISGFVIYINFKSYFFFTVYENNI